MTSAKAIRVAPIAGPDARRIVEAYHYSGTTVRNSQVHLGVFLAGRLEGCMSFGPPMDRSKVLGLVRDTSWAGMVELNRMAFSDRLPRNSESRALAIAARMFKTLGPQVEWILSFADGAQCGDGTIYRAAGFWLTAIRRNGQIFVTPRGVKFIRKSFNTCAGVRRAVRAELGPVSTTAEAVRAGAKCLPGFQLRYLLPLNETVRGRLTVPILDHSAIDTAGARMYLGHASEAQDGAPDIQSGGGV
jgi:hypothetical protein